MSSVASSAMPCYIYQLPAWVLDDLCRNMDTLNEWDWMQFASYVITDLTQLRKIKAMERVQGVSITRELLWWWGMRQATVQQLLDLLHRLELYRAAQIVLNWQPALESGSSSSTFLQPATPGRPERSTGDGQEKGQPVGPAGQPQPGSASTGAQQAFFSPPFEEDPSDSKDSSTSAPQQELLLPAEDSLFWREVDVVQATQDFSESHRISHGSFADIYRGQRHGKPFVFKTLREGTCSSPGSIERFFQAEIEMCRRCRHPSVLPLLGFCTGRAFHSLIYPYMANGSLQDRLHGQGSSDPLSWPQRIGICSGLLRAVEYLHGLDVIHSNIKSSNVLLDQNFSPKLAHPVAYLCAVNRKSKYTVMKTHLFQASAAYLPEDFIRVGQLTKRVDVFSCGIVLAETFTGIPAVDNTRRPAYLKDLLLCEIPSTATSPCSRRTPLEAEVAEKVRGVCEKLLERRAGTPPAGCARALAAACLCLRRRNASLDQMHDSVGAVEKQLGSEGTEPSSNTPEETDDVDNPNLDVSCSTGAVDILQVAASALPAESPGGASVGAEAPLEPAEDDTETSWKIEINEAKRKLMENILLYKAEKLDSVELFGP
ncbi:interleukin-1 receptor-associated kinase-like 2 [Ochotona curzoniae]|uniref:interleukin-1 receptor-associated kinase-like 2 n=1 Tax=Ochotona curzoniae TaxID=130825 RepID=UPI001B347512|nr:interleukin-1 receptor-associated kinase-like 2 [Ochotona curzoniae]